MFVFIKMKLLIFLLVILLIIIIIKKVSSITENFEYPSKKLECAILFTGYNIDKWDYEFIKKWHNDIKIYFIPNIDEKTTEESKKMTNKIKELHNVTTFERQNIGWDATAWKECIEKYYNELKIYDEVIMMNNSMNYEKLDMKQITEMAINYDVYGIFYTQLMKHNESYFTGFNKRTFNSKDFRDFYFKHFPVIESHGDAVIDYEMAITRYFEKKGYSFGSFIPNKMPHSLMYSTLPNVVDLNDVKYVTKKTHLKNQDNYNKWRKIK